jgi:hypothetical protein
MPDREIKNDPAIADSEVLLRRLLAEWVVPGDRGRMRIASAAFKSFELSILFLSLMERQGRPKEDALKEHPDDSLCSITAGLARQLEQGVIYDTEPPHDPAHGLVIGKKRQSIANGFARGAKWEIPSEPQLVTMEAS